MALYAPTALQLGALFALVAVAVVISFRFLSFPDLTVDGSFVLGASTMAVLTASGTHWLPATMVAVVAGAGAGLLPAVMSGAFGINRFLSGILAAMVLYSANLRVLGGANQSLFGSSTAFSDADTELRLSFYCLAALVATVAASATVFRTRWGLLLRGLGSNSQALRLGRLQRFGLLASGLALSNAIAAAGGALVAQYQSFADVNMGIGTAVHGFAAVFLGETTLTWLTGHARGIDELQRHRASGRLTGKLLSVADGQLLAAVLGSLVLFYVTTLTLYLGLSPTDTKAVSAVLLVVAVLARGRRESALLSRPTRFE